MNIDESTRNSYQNPYVPHFVTLTKQLEHQSISYPMNRLKLSILSWQQKRLQCLVTNECNHQQ